MEKVTVIELHPDLVIDRKSALDRIGDIAAKSVETHAPRYTDQVRLVRNYIKQRCPDYRNCRQEDFCFHCSSGQQGQLYRGETCLGCKLLTADAVIQIKGLATK